MTRFKFGHITDLHFGTKVDWLNPMDGTTSIRQRASRAYRHIVRSNSIRSIAELFYPSGFNPHVAQNLLHSLHQRLPALDAILVTGDLATTGEQADLRIAADYFGGKSFLWWQAGEGSVPSLLGQDTVLVTLPGNHDRYDGLYKQPISRQYEQTIGSYWDFDQQTADSHWLPTEETGRVRFTILDKEEARLAIVCADFSLDTAHAGEVQEGHFGQGRVAPLILQELITTTKQLKEEADELGLQSAVIWAVHFPPKSPLNDETLALIDEDQLVDAANACGVLLVLAGHTHETRAYLATSATGNSVPVICSGPSSGISGHDQYGYSIIELDNTYSPSFELTLLHYKWQDHMFRPQAGFPT